MSASDTCSTATCIYHVSCSTNQQSCRDIPCVLYIINQNNNNSIHERQPRLLLPLLPPSSQDAYPHLVTHTSTHNSHTALQKRLTSNNRRLPNFEQGQHACHRQNGSSASIRPLCHSGDTRQPARSPSRNAQDISTPLHPPPSLPQQVSCIAPGLASECQHVNAFNSPFNPIFCSKSVILSPISHNAI